MSEETKSPTQPRPSFFRRLSRAFGQLLGLALLTTIILGAIGLVLFAFNQQIASVITRAQVNEQNIESLRTAIDNVGDRSTTSIGMLDEDQQTQSEQLQALSAQLDNQAELLTQLESQLQQVISQTTQTDLVVLSLQQGVTGLQQDVISNTTSLDALGGVVDGAVGELNGRLNNVISTTATLPTQDDLAELQEAVVLFRVWEAISRARFHLAEGNAGLASDDVALALATAQTLPDQTGLDTLRLRLSLSQANLPDDPASATQDLLLAWDEIDRLLGDYVGLPATPEIEPTVTITQTTVITP